MRANCHCSSEVTIEGFWCCLWPFDCLTQWHKCWMLRVALLSWGSCHDNCAAAGNALCQGSCTELGVIGIPSASGILQAPETPPCTSASVCYYHSGWNMQMVLTGTWEGKKLLYLKADFCFASLISWLYQISLTFTSRSHLAMLKKKKETTIY